MICNQAASFNRCLFKVQQSMQEQMKTIRLESKGKGSAKVSPALDELQFLMDFNASITQAAAKTIEHLSDFVFIFMGNVTLACRDYLPCQERCQARYYNRTQDCSIAHSHSITGWCYQACRRGNCTL